MEEDFMLVWVSCGVTSAVAGYLAKQKYKNVRFYYIHIDSAHPDNERFIKDLERWYEQEIIRIRSDKYVDQFDVIERTGYVNGVAGARCTKELKKEVRFKLEKSFEPDLFEPNKPKILGQIHGYEFAVKEIQRAIDYAIEYPYTNPEFLLIDEKLTKPNCMQILLDAGIDLPMMYILGYGNNNCIGCTKGGMGYWNKIRVDFPDVFNAMAKAERIAKHSCINGVFLDELPPNAGRKLKTIAPACGFVCQALPDTFLLSKAQEVFYGKTTIKEIVNKMHGTETTLEELKAM